MQEIAKESVSPVTEGPSASSSDETRASYQERKRRLDDTIALRQPDRVPVAYMGHFWPARYAGISYRTMMYDHEALADAARRVVVDLQPDLVDSPFPLKAWGPTCEKIGLRTLVWPGHGMPDRDATYQYLDRECMRPEEYDEFIEDPTWFHLSKVMPRFAEAYEPFANMPQFPAFTGIGLGMQARFFADEAVQEAVRRLGEAGRAAQRAQVRAAAFQQELFDLGFPRDYSAFITNPYDYFGDYLRGSRGIMLDLYRRKDKLLAAMERVAPMLVRAAVTAAARSSCKVVLMTLHWGLDGFMSLQQFKTFYWPQLRGVMLRLIEHGLTPLVLWEGDCTSRLETIRDVPAGKCIYWFERTDLFRAKQMLGDVVCLRGNVPPSLLNGGTPEEVSAYCRRLIEEVGRGGGFILDGAIGIPDEARPDNVRAMFRSVHEYGC